MKVETSRFGTIEVTEDSVIRMTKGPIGFDEQKDYCLIQHRPDTKFRWMQSVDEPGLAFVVVDPSEFFDDYEIEVPDAEVAKLHLKGAEDALVLVLVSIGEQGKDITANLAAPIVVNSQDLTAAQVVLQDTAFMVKQPISRKLGDASTEASAGDIENTVTVKAA